LGIKHKFATDVWTMGTF